ncbi:hypothetical protein B566_EDAN012290 [Ephemera danica]|nr:hypothetical protein B566_EDAN012290 [Ephemera danica]
MSRLLFFVVLLVALVVVFGNLFEGHEEEDQIRESDVGKIRVRRIAKPSALKRKSKPKKKLYKQKEVNCPMEDLKLRLVLPQHPLPLQLPVFLKLITVHTSELTEYLITECLLAAETSIMSRLLFFVVLLVALVVVFGNLFEGHEEEDQVREGDLGKIRVRRIAKPSSHKRKSRPKKKLYKQKDVICPSAELKGIEKCCKVSPGEFFKKEDHTHCVGKKTDPYMARWLTMLQFNKLINTTTKQYSYVDYKMLPVDWKNCLSKNRTLEQCDKNGGRVTRVTVTTTITPTVAQEIEK